MFYEISVLENREARIAILDTLENDDTVNRLGGGRGTGIVIDLDRNLQREKEGGGDLARVNTGLRVTRKTSDIYEYSAKKKASFLFRFAGDPPVDPPMYFFFNERESRVIR